ncbi:tetratricopeptide repeat protein [Flavobacteriaceae bacterium LMO-SS05]
MKFIILAFCFPLALFGQPQFDVVEQLFVQKQFAKAQEVMIEYVASNPTDLKGVELLGDAYAYQKKWDEALSYYKKLTELDSNNANYYYKYGGALGMKALTVSKIKALTLIGDVKESFLKAVELDSNHIDVRWALVELYMKLPGIVGGSKTKSLNYANELEQLSQVDGYLAKGFIYDTDEQPDLAEAYYKKAIQVGGSLTCYNKLTTFYEKQNQPIKAISNIEATQKKHEHNLLNYEIGKIAAEYIVELDKGEQHLMIYLQNFSEEDDTSKAWAHYRLAQIYKLKGQRSQALKYIDLAISELPNIKPFENEKDIILKPQ